MEPDDGTPIGKSGSPIASSIDFSAIGVRSQKNEAMNKRKKTEGQGGDIGTTISPVPGIIHSPVRLFTIVLGAILIGESSVMLVIHMFMPPMRHELVGLIDAFMLMVLITPILYILYYKPLRKNISLLEISEQKNKAITQFANSAIIKIDSEGKITFWNQAAEKIFGYTPDEALGEELHPLIAPKRYHQDANKGLMHYSKTGKGTNVGKTVELIALRKGGFEFPVELSVSAVEINDQWHAIGLVHDITLRREAEDKIKASNINLKKALNELEKTQAMLIRSEKLASLGQLSAGVAHEIKNPINIILANVQLIMMEENLSDDVKESCETMFGQVGRMVKIIDNLRDFAKERKPEKRRIDLHSFLDKTIALVEYEMTSESIDIKKDYFGEPIIVEGDEDQLAQVFLNIITNARYSMNRKRASQKEKQAGRLSVRTCVDHENVRIEFADTGTGIPKDAINKIFDPFVTTKPEDEGTGLGLSIALGIIENHGGTINASSEAHEGAMFTVIVPLEKKSEAKNINEQ